jgi:hypothetical protein
MIFGYIARLIEIGIFSLQILQLALEAFEMQIERRKTRTNKQPTKQSF